MKLLTCLHTNSECYGAKRKAITPVGIVVHSTGANNPTLRRYVQPSPSDPRYEELMSAIGVNRYGNHWNRAGVYTAVHYMIGKLASEEVGVVKLLPEEIAAWGVGKGKNGSYNYAPTGHIQFEICEDNLCDKSYFYACYTAATELCADICRRYGWDASVIVSHREAHARGYASNHADIDHWLSRYGLSMKDFRSDVDALLSPPRLPQVGDLVDFTGRTHYVSANSLLPSFCRSGRAYITKIYRLGQSKHPYHLIKVKGGTSTVYGWVDEGSFEVVS